MPFERFMLSDCEVVIIHANFEEFNFFVCRASGQIAIIGGYFHFEDVLIVYFDGLLILFGHVLAVEIDEAFIISKGHSL